MRKMDEEDDVTGKGDVPPEDADIQIEFVDEHEPTPPEAPRPEPARRPPPLKAVPPPEPERGIGILEIDVDAEETLLREKDQRIEALQEAAANLQDKLFRSRAEFDNYKKRADRDREELGRAATAAFVKEILPVLDSLDRAVKALESEAPPEWCKGVELVRQQFTDVLAKNGVEKTDALGKAFDPALHEAVMTSEVPDAEPGAVTAVLEEGYTSGGKLVRPARVVVNRRPDHEPGEGGPGA
jgi:molecular chaperone GrpE